MNSPSASPAPPVPEEKRQQVVFELERILSSPSFRGSVRSKQFLQYVVQHQLDGHAEPLKERTIGADVFQRPPGYATGEDPVVRVQAGEVRRRLDQFYNSGSNGSPVRIELPLGSYSPIFHWHVGATAVPAPARRKRIWPAATVGVLALIVLGAWMWWRAGAHQRSDFDQFWNPVFTTQQPALICLAKGVTYRPGPQLYERYERTHPEAFQTEVERFSQPLPLDPKEKLTWGDMELLNGYGVALGDVSAAVKFSTLLGKLGKANQLRIGANYSYADLRNSPAIVIGAFNNRWTMDLLSSQHFAFLLDHGEYEIHEQAPGTRVWKSQYSKSGALEEDYAMVARLLDSKTGQFTVVAAGLRDSGTEAAGEFASNAKYAEEVLHTAPSGWQKKNLEIVLKTRIIDSIPGPLEPVAVYIW